ncbi:hypothetical protein T265_13621, partial [Opisthorchis viverrini]
FLPRTLCPVGSTCIGIGRFAGHLRCVTLVQVNPRRNYAEHQSPDKSQIGQPGMYGGALPSGIEMLLRWWHRLRPWKEELADLRRRIIRNKEGFDPPVPNLTRYFVRFPFLTDAEFTQWRVTTDQQLGVGHSWAEFVRSSRSAPGCAVPLGVDGTFAPMLDESPGEENADHPFAYTYPPTYPKRGPLPGSKQAASDALVSSATDRNFRGYGLFRGFISTRVPDRGDIVRAGFVSLSCPESTMFGFLMPYAFFSYSHLVIRYRGDGRSYRINILVRPTWDSQWFETHHFVLYTRGGPYWQVAKIPLSKFFLLSKGTVRLSQFKLPQNNIRLMNFTLMDGVDGPFSLELDYIALYKDPDHHEKFAYEQYDRSGILK